MKTYTQSYSSDIKPLPVPTPFIAGESLTSWLLRASFNQGCDYSALIFYHWSAYKILPTDFDKGFNQISPKIHEDIAALMNSNKGFVEAQTLVAYNERLGMAVQENSKIKWVVPYIKNIKKATGHPYCFHCFRQGKDYLQQQWRYSWYIYCDAHRLLLDDSCPHCSMPYQPHLIKIPQHSFIECPHCHGDLSIAPTNMIVSKDALSFQQNAQQALLTGKAMIFGNEYKAIDWFELMLYYMNFIRKGLRDRNNNIYIRAFNSLNIEIFDIPLVRTKTGLAFDLLPINERVALMAYSNQLAMLSAEKWIETLLDVRATQGTLSFGKNPTIPKALIPIYEQLPSTNSGKKTKYLSKKTPTRVMKPKTTKAVLLAWERLQVKIEKVKAHGEIRKNTARKQQQNT